MKRNEKERKGMKRNDFSESIGIMFRNDRKNDRKRPKTTEEMGHLARDWGMKRNEKE